MARTPIYTNPKKANVIMESDVYAAGRKRAFQLELSGGFSEYVARLIIADMARKASAALRNGRKLPVQEGAK